MYGIPRRTRSVELRNHQEEALHPTPCKFLAWKILSQVLTEGQRWTILHRMRHSLVSQGMLCQVQALAGTGASVSCLGNHDDLQIIMAR
jgi:hypothetical protein